jgi:hypothetical protein
MYRNLILSLTLIIGITPSVLGMKKEMAAKRVSEKIVIDGRLDEPVWGSVTPANEFMTYSPTMGQPAGQRSEVRVVYNNRAVYIGAILYDTAPDSIMTELTKRDNFSNANTDKFRITLNPYNDGQNLYHFEVSASNVQADYKKGASSMTDGGDFMGHGDYSWNAVWKSAAVITGDGWIVEVEIPYAALRFPKVPVHTWGINFMRTVRRTREVTTWNPVDRSFSEDDQIGVLRGIESIKAPLRLELYPFAAGYYQVAPEAKGFSYAAGMDLKYGINEAYTLDMTLIPDFGQRKSDQIILNLTPFEVKYTENRQFFTEGMELFDKSGLFYSRRVGKQPIWYGGAWDSLAHGETLLENPGEARLINATKISGRNSKNLGIGFFNAMTANTFASVQEVDGDKRKVLTDPFTNYNMLVFDQIIGRNSFVNFSNTNVYSPATTRMANVAGVTTRFMDRNNRYGFSINMAGNAIFDSLGSAPKTGYTTEFGAGRYRGAFTYAYDLAILSDTYDINDMGYLKKNNFISHEISLAHRILEPVGIFNSINNSLQLAYNMIYNPRAYSSLTAAYSTHFLFLDYSDISISIMGSPFNSHDYYEPRVAGRYFVSPAYYGVSTRGSSDYRKKLAFNAGFGFNGNAWGEHGYDLSFGPRIRFNDRLSIFPSFKWADQRDDRGFVGFTGNDSIVFGRRNVKTVTNSITGSYVFNNKAALSLVFRHYWSQVNYNEFYILEENGEITSYSGYNKNKDLDFNVFSIDLEYAWNFAPGSYLTAVWKNNINRSQAIEGEMFTSYWRNLETTVVAPQTNSFSVKVSYYLDYQRVLGRQAP